MDDVKSQKNLQKNGKKTNINVPVETDIADLFDKWQSALPGGKGEKLSAALKAVMAIHSISPDLLFRLMDSSTTVENAKSILIQGIVDFEIQQRLAPLTEEQRTQMLLRAKQEAEKVVRSKK